MSDLVVSQAQLALDLLHHSRKSSDATTPEAAFLSPVSIAVALAMTYAGADGNTKKEMNKALFGGAEDKLIHGRFESFLSALREEAEGYKLHSANRLYVQEKFDLLDSFTKLLQGSYNGEFRRVNFADGVAVASEINKWVESATHAKIRDLIKPDALDAMTRLVLVNAVYFKGDWATQFKKERTEKRPFYVAENKEKTVEMMKMTEKLHYGEHSDVQVLGLPYKGHDVFMYVLLPREKYGLGKFEAALTGARLMELIRSTDRVIVELQLPKFKMETQLELNETLQTMGVKDAFNEKTADFSQINGHKDLFISAVIHKAFIEMNEEGTEAAAAIANIMVCGLPDFSREPPVPRFVADHPFVFAIVKNEHILFVGRFV